jgi:hypothetical protein
MLEMGRSNMGYSNSDSFRIWDMPASAGAVLPAPGVGRTSSISLDLLLGLDCKKFPSFWGSSFCFNGTMLVRNQAGPYSTPLYFITSSSLLPSFIIQEEKGQRVLASKQKGESKGARERET